MPDFEMRPVVVAPTYNNVQTLGDVVRRIHALNLSIIVVNDGSTDGTAELLDTLRNQMPRLSVATHRQNRGKAAALHSGFGHAISAGFTHAVTIDTDGQLDPEEFPAFLDAARRNPTALILGRRADAIDGYPARSRLGRRVSNLFIRLESGIRVDDSQCGFRVYPLGLIATVKCRVGHHGFETEVITRAGWAGCPIVQVPVTCRYLPPATRVSHFRPGLDTLRAMGMHLVLLGRALLPLPRAPRWPDGVEKPDHRLSWRGLWHWLNPVRVWHVLKRSDIGRGEIAAGLAAGVFIANLPVYGLQSLMSLYTARRLHLHPVTVLLGSQISTPPISFGLLAAGFGMGHLLIHGSLPAMAEFDPRRAGWWAVVGPRLLELSVGSVVVGFFMAVATFVGAIGLMRLMGTRRRKRERGQAGVDEPAAEARAGA